jgi:hypothetical protein
MQAHQNNSQPISHKTLQHNERQQATSKNAVLLECLPPPASHSNIAGTLQRMQTGDTFVCCDLCLLPQQQQSAHKPNTDSNHCLAAKITGAAYIVKDKQNLSPKRNS